MKDDRLYKTYEKEIAKDLAEIEKDKKLYANYDLETCMIKTDLCTLDNALENSYVSHLLSGKTINLVYNTFVSSLQTIVSTDTQINVSRSLSKMKSIASDKYVGEIKIRSPESFGTCT